MNLFVAFDGTDGSGKSCQIQMLADYLKSKGESPLVLDHPTKDGLGGFLRKLMHADKQRFSTWAEAFLYAADLAETALARIKPALEAGRPVLVHRWWYSSCVYQAAIDGADWDGVKHVSLLAVDGIHPNVGFIMMCDPKVAMTRIGTRPGEIVSPYENEKHLQQAFDGFTRLLNTSQDVQEPLFMVDTSTDTPEETHQNILTGLRSVGYGA